MIDFYSPLKDAISWIKKRNEIREIEPFVLDRPNTDILKQRGLLSGLPEDFVFVRPESVSEKTEVPSPAHEVVFLFDTTHKTKRKVICMANGRIDLVLLKKCRA